ncbi:MAG: hypothetical protein ACPGNV_18030 [Mangrovicoccus sp.]
MASFIFKRVPPLWDWQPETLDRAVEERVIFAHRLTGRGAFFVTLDRCDLEKRAGYFTIVRDPRHRFRGRRTYTHLRYILGIAFAHIDFALSTGLLTQADIQNPAKSGSIA